MPPRFHCLLVDSAAGLLDFASAGLTSSISCSSIARSGRGRRRLSIWEHWPEREGKQRDGGKSRAAHPERGRGRQSRHSGGGRIAVVENEREEWRCWRWSGSGVWWSTPGEGGAHGLPGGLGAWASPLLTRIISFSFFFLFFLLYCPKLLF
jgi:hypothetical protein